jgi:lysine 2,3-aminomutase
MRALCTGLMKMRVRPYYLYQCDPIRGGEHFRTPISKGIEIIEGMRGHTSGLAIPTYVIDAPGGGGKIPVGPNYLLHHDAKKKRAVLRNFQGRIFEYREPTGRAGPMTSKARRGGGELKPAGPRPASPIGSTPPVADRPESERAAGRSGWVHRGRSLEERLPPPKA